MGNIIASATTTSARAFSDYAYGEDLTEEISCFLGLLARSGNVNLQPRNIAVTLNATNALYLSLHALKRLGVNRFLVITPTYYSVIETLDSFGSSVIYHHLLDEEAFFLDLKAIRRAVEWQQIDAIILTDPVYSAGIEHDISAYSGLSAICNEHHIWLLCDYALGGLFWHRPPTRLLDAAKLSALSSLERFIYIESPPKRLFLNGMKHAAVVASSNVTNLIHDLASRMSGGFCSTQLSVLKALYDPNNQTGIVAYMEGNRLRIEANFASLQSSLLGTAFYTYSSNSGHFTMLCHKHRRIENANTKRIVKRLLWEHGLYVLPSEHFSYYGRNHFGVRINLMNDVSAFLIPLNRALTEDPELLDAFR
ncbi:MAG TPA: pyridoxal phosphate-dependent aminotransferase [Chthoniobacterales bacterium]|nr:pyridoxal phosphate-dependent aminotransferase [Chthoniobacterales bacterium]